MYVSVNDEEAMDRIKGNRTVIKRKRDWTGHIIRRKEILTTLLEGIPEVERWRSRNERLKLRDDFKRGGYKRTGCVRSTCLPTGRTPYGEEISFDYNSCAPWKYVTRFLILKTIFFENI